MRTLTHKIKLNNGVEIPQFGLGVYQSRKGDETQDAIKFAFEAGYRHIDTAMIYGNGRDVGKAVRDSGIARDSIFITTKLWNSDHGHDSTLAALDKSLQRLELEYVDLYLVHWPVADLRLESWRAMETLLEQGKCRAIGVSNYLVWHLEELLAVCNIPPAVNQIEMSPYIYLHRKATIDLCAEKDIKIEAYSPLTKGERLRDPKLVEMAGRYKKTTAQLLIRWCLEHDFIVIPKSVRRQRIIENADVFDFTISKDDMTVLDAMNENFATSWDPTDAP